MQKPQKETPRFLAALRQVGISNELDDTYFRRTYGSRFYILSWKDEYYPYAVPVNYVYDGEAIYLHSASAGHKIDSIRRNPRCSICVVDKDDVIPEEFTSYFRSVIAFGHAKILDREDEKIKILRMLSETV